MLLLLLRLRLLRLLRLLLLLNKLLVSAMKMLLLSAMQLLSNVRIPMNAWGDRSGVLKMYMMI